MKTKETAESLPIVSKMPATTWVHDVLDPDQLSGAKRRFGRCKLGKGTLILFWGLRIYVVLMIFLVALSIWNTLHSGK
jgi:hypothetical protein